MVTKTQTLGLFVVPHIGATTCSQSKEASQDANGIRNPIKRITIAPAGNRLSNFDGGPKDQKADQHMHPP